MAPTPYPHATGEALKTVQAHADTPDAAIVFHAGWFCPFVQRVWIALEEKGIPYKYNEVNPYKKEKDFLEISPKGLVPAIAYNGKPINESLVILEFLEDAYPEKSLLPKDPYLRARVRLAIEQVSKSIIPNFFKLLQAVNPEAQGPARENFYEALRAFEATIQGPFWAGEQFTLADVVITPWMFRLNLLEEHRSFVPSQVGAKFSEWRERVINHPSVVRTLSEDDKYLTVYSDYINDTSDTEVAKAIRSGRALP